jgi:hypothetical protein
LPALESDVAIDLPGQYQVNLDIEPPTLNSFTLNSRDATLNVAGHYVNVNGQSRFERGRLILSDAGWQGQQPVINRAFITVLGQSTVRSPLFLSHEDGAILGSGTLNVVGSSLLGGLIEPDLAVSHGDMSIASLNSFGRLELAGDFVLGDSSELKLELGGSEPGETFDRLIVGGKVVLSGSIRIDLAEDFLPDPCQRFSIIDSAGLPSNPSTAVVGLQLPQGMGLRPEWSASGLSLTAFRQSEAINVFPDELTVTEGGDERAYQVCLGGIDPPQAAIQIVATADRQVSIMPTELRFDPAHDDWQATKTFTVSAVDDVQADGDRVSPIGHRSQSADPSFDSAANPDLLIRDVRVQARDNDIHADRFEPQSGFDNPAHLGSADQTHTGLTIHQPDDDDWYEWTAPDRGTLAVSIFFEHVFGDLELWVYRDLETVEVWSGTQTDNEHVELPVLAGEKYFIRVFGQYGATQPNYDLVVRLMPDEPRVYVSTGDEIRYYDFDGRQLGVIQHPQFSSCTLGDVEIGANGLVYVACDGSNLLGDRIIEFTPNGTFSRTLSVPLEAKKGSLPYPRGFDVLEDDTLLVAQPNDGQLVRVGRRGRILQTHQSGLPGAQDATVLGSGRVIWTDESVHGRAQVNPAGNRTAWFAYPELHEARLIDHSGMPLASRFTGANLFPVEAQEADDKSLFVLSTDSLNAGLLSRYDETGTLIASVALPFPTGLAVLGADRPARVPIADEDGDGLLDSWETSGIDINGDGTIDLDLPRLGTDPERKDLFVEVDAMFGRGPLALSDPIPELVDRKLNTNTVLDRVTQAFLKAPVTNPDGTTGIQLHLMVDETTLPLRSFDSIWAEFQDLKFGSDSEYRDGTFGTVAERQSPNWPQIWLSKRMVFRYALFADQVNGESMSGIAELPGDDLLMTLGTADVPGGTADEQAGTFMHQLGHTLGLQHGGGDNIDFKPNYFSVMNDHWRVPNENQGWELDFSRNELPALDEARLLESRGIGFPESGPHNERSVHVGPLPFQMVALAGAVDWNRDGQISPDLLVQADINRGFADSNNDGLINLLDDQARHLLKGHDDWSNLRFSLAGLQNVREYENADLDHPERPDSDLASLFDNYPPDVADQNPPGNDTPGTAHRLDSRDPIFGLTIDDSSDVDWFAWQADFSGELNLGIDTSFVGGLELTWLDETKAELAKIANSSDESFEQVGVTVENGKSYFIQVAGLEGTEAIYNLLFNAGDFDLDSRVDASDISHLCQNMGPGRQYDLDGDARATDSDLDYLVRSILRTSFGDVNLDGVFDSADLVDVFQAGNYEDGKKANSVWSTGDWNCDHEFDSSDLVEAFKRGSYVAAARPGVGLPRLGEDETARHNALDDRGMMGATRDAIGSRSEFDHEVRRKQYKLEAPASESARDSIPKQRRG